MEVILSEVSTLVRSGLVSRGEFNRPLELFREFVLQTFPEELPSAAEEIIARILKLSVESAAQIPPGLQEVQDFGEAP